MSLEDFKKVSAADLVKGIVAVTVAVVATLAWMDGRFLTRAEAKDNFVKKEKVDKLQRIITYQQLSLVERDIEDEKKRSNPDHDKLRILYQQKEELKRSLGVTTTATIDK